MPAKHILIQNYHPSATRALIRDFQRIGFTVYSPDSNWGRIAYYGGNAGLGGELISEADFFALEPGFVLIPCKLQEDDLKAIAREHADELILNIAQHGQPYQTGLSQIMICPDIITYDMYPETLRHKLLYFLRPHLSATYPKNPAASFAHKNVRSYVSMPHVWVNGYAAYREFRAKYPYRSFMHGFETPDGHLSHVQCNAAMTSAFLTVHFKDDESYGLACLESMALGTPILSLNSFVRDKTLGRFFLDETNAILADTVEEAIERALQVTVEDYTTLSLNAQNRVTKLTSDQNTIEKLRDALNTEYPDLAVKADQNL